MVNNFDLILPLLQFDEKNQDYFLIQVIQRKKDGNGVKGSNRNRTIKSYHVCNEKQFLDKKEEIINLCNFFNARAYININPKPVMSILFKILDICKDTLQTMWHGDHPMSIVGMVDSAIAQVTPKGNKASLVIDIDKEEVDYMDDIIQIVKHARSGYDNNILSINPTVNGFHILTHRFDKTELETKYSKKEDSLIKINSYTLLYASV